MSKVIIITVFLICLVASFQQKLCAQGFHKSYLQLIKLSSSSISNETKINILTDFALKVPSLLNNCGQKKLADAYSSQVPTVCINDLNRAAKLLNKIINEKDNQIKAAMDTAILERMYVMKIKKSCPFLKDITLEDIRAGGVCLESVYKLSLLFQTLAQDYAAGKKTQALQDLSVIIQNLPDTFDKCGYSNIANIIKNSFPPQCVKAIDNFSTQLSKVIHNYDHIEWVYKNYPQFLQTLRTVKRQCPQFN